MLVLGASSGIGKAIAQLYAARGAKVCVVGRRKDKLDEVVQECNRELTEGDRPNTFAIAGDFSNADDMVRIRTTLETG